MLPAAPSFQRDLTNSTLLAGRNPVPSLGFIELPSCARPHPPALPGSKPSDQASRALPLSLPILPGARAYLPILLRVPRPARERRRDKRSARRAAIAHAQPRFAFPPSERFFPRACSSVPAAP